MEKLTKAERDALIEKYAEDRLNMPPVNILDSTLVNSYGSEEQKARFAAAAEKKEKAAKAPKTAEKSSAKTEAQTAKDSSDGEATESDNGDTERYVQAFNKYSDVFGVVPADNLSAEQLENMVKEQEKADKAEEEKAEKAAKVNTKLKAGQVEIVSKATGEKVRVSEYTWQNFIKKDGTHTIAVDTPEELKNNK